MKITISVLLLAVFACKGHELEDTYSLPYEALACEDRELYLNCPHNYIISARSAFYGRDDAETCVAELPQNSTKSTALTCNATGVLERVKELCDNKQDCYLQSLQDFDPDSQCDLSFNYLKLSFFCVLPIYDSLSCDRSQLTLSCQGDSVVTILDAFYGRKDLATCGEDGVTSFNDTCESDYARAAVSVLCNGKQDCDIYVSGLLLGDECGGDFKYLEVSYACASCGNEFGNDEACKGYAEDGECEANPGWMTAFCRESCYGCKYTDLCDNIENDGDCDFWASSGHCDSNSDYMTQNCRKSCNRCAQLLQVPPGKLSPVQKEVCELDAVILHCEDTHFVRIDSAFYGRLHNDTCADAGVVSLDCDAGGDVVTQLRTLCEGRQSCWFEALSSIYGDPCPGNSKMGNVQFTCQRCYNAFVDSECDLKAELGECETNREWMMDNCYRACTRCYTAVECYNTHENTVDCDFWSLTGECDSNPDWMTYNCEESCHTCHTFTPQFSGSYNEVVCEGSQTNLRCSARGEFISIDHVFFGRDDIDTCPHDLGNVTDCAAAEGATESVGDICGGRKSCSFEARPLSWGDPCPGVYKLARVKYHCQACENVYPDDVCEVKASSGRCTSDYHFMQEYCFKTCSKCDLETCGNAYDNTVDCDFWGMRGECESVAANVEWMHENCAETCGRCPPGNETIDAPTTVIPDKTDTVSLEACEAGILPVNCDPGYRIWIQDMFFGRNSQEVCPGDAANTTECEAVGAEALVQEYCNGQEKCYISAHHLVFGDPCEGTSKHATVDYACHTCANILDDSLCEYKQAAGECESNYTAMMRDCYKTCSGCDRLDCVNTYNSDEDCDYWSMRGECQINPGWMAEFCQRSCRGCYGLPTAPPPTQDPDSEDLDKQNPVFMEACEGGEVQLNCTGEHRIRLDLIFFGRSGTTTCPHEDLTGDETCPSPGGLFSGLMELCNGRQTCWYETLTEIWGDPCPGVYKHGHVQYTCQRCVDVLSDSDCQAMREENKCYTDYAYMMDNCFKTCSKCDESGCGNTYSSHIDCDFWAVTGNCITNPGFMYEYCQESCGVCVDMTCPQGFKGEGCKDNDCSLVNECSGNGECTGPNTCTCVSGYGGTDCSDYRCNGVNDCSNNGRCYGPNQCLCFPYFSGDDCGECSVAFEAGPNCMPCPECIHGSCVQEDDLPLGPAVDVTPSQDGGTYKQLQREGVGDATPQPGDTLYTHYHGTLTDGTLFDASRPRGNMFIFKIGTGYVIRGWEVALPTMKRGEIATLTIRPDYAYGTSGLGNSIPPNATLIIRVELWDFRNTCSDVAGRDSCLDREADGECSSNYEWMNLNCERTCKFCGERHPIPDTCVNLYEPEQDCEYWAGIGECVLNPSWMLVQCNKSCNACGDQCTNALTTDAKDEDCDYWAKIGECDLGNSDWMKRNCPKSCGFCDDGLPDTDTCKNEHVSDVNCDYWARLGECDVTASKPWMQTNCRKSCGLCEGIRGPSTKSYMGCFADDASEPDLDHTAFTESEDTSTFSCMQRCYALGYKYAATQNGDSCYCGHSYGRHGEAPGQCDVPCSGAPGDFCGGDGANSVWRVYEGKCECEGGWNGDRCDQCAAGSNCGASSPTTASTTTAATTPTMPTMTSSPYMPSTVPESSTITMTTTSTTPTTKPSESTLTSTERSTSPSVTYVPSNEIAFEVKVMSDWMAEYADLQNPSTIFFINDIKRDLLSYYREVLDGVLDIRIIRLREGSVIVEHHIVFEDSMSESAMEDMRCLLYDDIGDGKGIGDTSITSSDQLENTCKGTEDTTQTTTEISTQMPSNNVALEITLVSVWNPKYEDLDDPVTRDFTADLRQKLLSYYQELLHGVTDVIITRLREGSVVVEHRVRLAHGVSRADREDFLCDVYDDITRDKNIGDLQMTASRQLEKECKWRESYCENDGRLYRNKQDKWKCDCKDDTTGQRCQTKKLSMGATVAIAVACSLVPIAIVIISCLVIHRRNHFRKMERLKSRQQESLAHFPQQNSIASNTQFRGKTKTTLRSATKLFNDSKENELADNEGFFPSQI